MSTLITNQAAFDDLADRIYTANQRINAKREDLARREQHLRWLRDIDNNLKGRGRRAGRVSLTRLASVAIAPVNNPKHRAEQEQS